MRTVGGQPLPAIISAAPGDTLTAVAGALWLFPDGTAAISEQIRAVHPGAPASTNDYTTDYTYTMIGDSLVFAYRTPCPANANCAAPPGGKLSGLELTLTFGNPPLRPPFKYFKWLPY
ncbi:MAG: hypothetical protein ABR585_07205 [Gemmatimonadaceae bacterium]